MRVEVISLIVSVLAAVIGLRATFVSGRTLRNSSYRGAADLVLDADHLFLEHPDLRAFFYDGKEVPGDEFSRQLVLAAAEFYLDILEAIWDHRAEFARSDIDAWREWIHDLLEYSPAMRLIYNGSRDWYPSISDLLTWDGCSKAEHTWARGQPGPNGYGFIFHCRRMTRNVALLKAWSSA